jgi:hypothetical protein
VWHASAAFCRARAFALFCFGAWGGAVLPAGDLLVREGSGSLWRACGWVFRVRMLVGCWRRQCFFSFFHALRVAPYVARGSSFVVGGDVGLVSGLPLSDVFSTPQNSVVDFAERSVGEGLAAFWGGMKTSRAC